MVVAARAVQHASQAVLQHHLSARSSAAVDTWSPLFSLARAPASLCSFPRSSDAEPQRGSKRRRVEGGGSGSDEEAGAEEELECTGGRGEGERWVGGHRVRTADRECRQHASSSPPACVPPVPSSWSSADAAWVRFSAVSGLLRLARAYDSAMPASLYANLALTFQVRSMCFGDEGALSPKSCIFESRMQLMHARGTGPSGCTTLRWLPAVHPAPQVCMPATFCLPALQEPLVETRRAMTAKLARAVGWLTNKGQVTSRGERLGRAQICHRLPNGPSRCSVG